MDVQRLISMLGRMFLRKAMTKGLNAGIDLVARKGKAPADMTPADHDQARKARDLAKRARQAARITRRLGR
jgi:hypothetical protein